MISYFNIPTFALGPLTIHTWGLFVAAGFAVSFWVAHRRAKQLELDGHKILDLVFWILIFAFIGARLFHVFFYEWMYYKKHLLEILQIDQGGLSSFGGFIGAAVTFLVYGYFRVISTKRLLGARGEISHGTSFKGVRSLGTARDDGGLLSYADLLMFAWPLGHAIGRLGCFLTHMHPGRLSSMPWAVQYPGGARLDMGLVESVILFLYFIVLVFLSRRHVYATGFYVVSGMIFYGIVRFTLDFFRAADLPMSDTRYFGLTPAQYGSIILVIIGMIFWKNARSRKN